mmetsp:Transcript_6560/g.19801  ORF Transcript_6560/g.19801 Transcript_6560/m.19801 type:complete len:216 (+) Transcript_6560:192-839(+)
MRVLARFACELSGLRVVLPRDAGRQEAQGLDGGVLRRLPGQRGRSDCDVGKVEQAGGGGRPSADVSVAGGGGAPEPGRPGPRLGEGYPGSEEAGLRVPPSVPRQRQRGEVLGAGSLRQPRLGRGVPRHPFHRPGLCGQQSEAEVSARAWPEAGGGHGQGGLSRYSPQHHRLPLRAGTAGRREAGQGRRGGRSELALGRAGWRQEGPGAAEGALHV